MKTNPLRSGDAEDFVLPFQVADTAVRGRLVRLSSSVHEILSAHQFPDVLSELVGEAAALVTLMGAALKFDGKLILQAQGDGPVAMVVADYHAGGDLRATAKTAAEARDLRRGAEALLGKGHIAITIDQGPDMERYQGVTPIEGVSLADAAVAYFKQSEQIPTVVKLAVARAATPGMPDQWRAGGVMAQFVPGEGGARERGEETIMDDRDRESWERAAAFIETVQPDELVDPIVTAETLLYRLFHEDGVRVFEPQSVRATCGCSLAKIARVLANYAAEDLQEMVENGAIHVVCEFCRTAYGFAPDGKPLDDEYESRG